MILYRPIGQREYDLIQQSNFKQFPPRLSWQPIFYPVLDYNYACTIAKDWNTNDKENGYVGYVTQFEVSDNYIKQYTIQNVGSTNHNELWIPSEDLQQLNDNIIGKIEIINIFYGDKYEKTH